MLFRLVEFHIECKKVIQICKIHVYLIIYFLDQRIWGKESIGIKEISKKAPQ